ncbi:hypothetical protein LCGC14_1404630 [marine sediment metagenome]|uniref:Uncharacterized protein n=1 Tax=marine sediment metagenome TaxID=412755 RepID=A0A0F9MBH7_9ZZZZ
MTIKEIYEILLGILGFSALTALGVVLLVLTGLFI